MLNIICGDISPKEIVIDKNELSSRLLVPKGYDLTLYEKSAPAVISASSPKFCYFKTAVKISDGIADLGFAKFASKNLCRNLQQCTEAFVMAVTLGIGVDRLISRLAVTSGAESFAADGIASALAEGAADKLSEILAQNAPLRPRFSPGYGDLALSVQKEILSALSAEKLCGITLGDNLLMTPMKSITAIQGIC